MTQTDTAALEAAVKAAGKARTTANDRLEEARTELDRTMRAARAGGLSVRAIAALANVTSSRVQQVTAEDAP